MIIRFEDTQSVKTRTRWSRPLLSVGGGSGTHRRQLGADAGLAVGVGTGAVRQVFMEEKGMFWSQLWSTNKTRTVSSVESGVRILYDYISTVHTDDLSWAQNPPQLTVLFFGN